MSTPESSCNCSLLNVINLAKHIPRLTSAYSFMWAWYSHLDPKYICESVIRAASSFWPDTFLYVIAFYSQYFTH